MSCPVNAEELNGMQIYGRSTDDLLMRIPTYWPEKAEGHSENWLSDHCAQSSLMNHASDLSWDNGCNKMSQIIRTNENDYIATRVIGIL